MCCSRNIKEQRGDFQLSHKYFKFVLLSLVTFHIEKHAINKIAADRHRQRQNKTTQIILIMLIKKSLFFSS